MTMPVGAQISGYTIERVLGAGGMGTVYLAKHPTLPRSVALKVLSAELSADPEFQTRFRREADLAASLGHPNIVRVYTRGQADDGRLWIAMQFIDGTDAGNAAEHGPLPVNRTLHIIGEIAKALDFAHSRKLLHRDIKPANFLLAGQPGPHERVLLADFGIARALDEATRLTATGSMMATVAYASPEAIEGQPLDHRADLYSLGCALYRLLTGNTPFQDAGTMSAVMMAHLTKSPPPATTLNPQLPQAINDVLAIALAKNRNDRFDTAAELYEAAQAALLHNQKPDKPVPDAATVLLPSAARQAHTYPTGRLSGAITQLAGLSRDRRRRLLIGFGALTALAAVFGAATIARTAEETAPYPPQSFSHMFGSTRIEHRPHAVAAMSLTDADVAVSLGIQPVAIVTPGGGTKPPSWLAGRISPRTAILPNLDPAALKQAAPDLIIDTGDISKDQYDELSGVAATITRPTAARRGLPLASRISWLGNVLGALKNADRLDQEMKSDQEQIRIQYPKFVGQSATVLTFSDSGVTAMLSNSPAAGYLTGLGLTYNSDLKPSDSGTIEKPLRMAEVYSYESPITVIIRTDKLAGSGGYYGLPKEILNFNFPLTVIDDPDIITALNSGGPTAIHYLNDTFLPAAAARLG